MLIPAIALTKQRVVGILEDDSYIADLVDAALGMFGFEPKTIRDEKEAVALAIDEGVRAFVLDVQIHTANVGLDVLESLKELDRDTFVCIYSQYVETPVLRRRAERLHADFIQPKTENPRQDLAVVASALLRHQERVIRRTREVIDLHIRRSREGEPPLIDWETGRINHALLNEAAEWGFTGTAAAGEIEADDNILTFNRLIADSEWRNSHLGKAVGIVHGRLVCVSDTLQNAVELMRKQYPNESRFVTTVEQEENIFDIPTPFDVED